jgi:hypothetical protein
MVSLAKRRSNVYWPCPSPAALTLFHGWRYIPKKQI